MKPLFTAAVAAARSHSPNGRTFTLGAVAIRADGKWVCSNNASAKLPTPTGHAEARVLRKAGKGAVLIVARVRRDGSLGLAYPCRACRALIRSKGVVRVYYSVGGHYGEFTDYIPGDYGDVA